MYSEAKVGLILFSNWDFGRPLFNFRERRRTWIIFLPPPPPPPLPLGLMWILDRYVGKGVPQRAWNPGPVY